MQEGDAMFEKVLAGERHRTRQRNRLAITASVMAHALVAMGAARVPLNHLPRPQTLEETVSFLDLPVPAAPVPLHRPAPIEHSPMPATTPGDAQASGEATPEPAGAAEVSALPERLPDLSAELMLPVALAAAPSLRLPRFAAARAASPDMAAARGEVVEADVLAERPRLANRWQMERVWQSLYPRLLEIRGVAGEAVISFVIDEEGRVEAETVEVVSATRPEFGDAVLRGVRLLRFHPMRVGGIPVRVRTVMPVLWTLPAA
jgi:TonB family protein